MKCDDNCAWLTMCVILTLRSPGNSAALFSHYYVFMYVFAGFLQAYQNGFFNFDTFDVAEYEHYEVFTTVVEFHGVWPSLKNCISIAALQCLQLVPQCLSTSNLH